jgi:hypothetical protein
MNQTLKEFTTGIRAFQVSDKLKLTGFKTTSILPEVFITL